MKNSGSTGDQPGLFPQTRWSLVLAAARPDTPESTAALETLCRLYWNPLCAYARHCGQTPHDAQDLVQEFFAQLLDKNWLETADRDRGRLRTFLIVALKNFMRKKYRDAHTQKRGGDQHHTTLSSLPSLASLSENLDQLFDRDWALTLLELTMGRLQEEFKGAGKSHDFEILKTCLAAEHGALDYAAVAKALNVNFGAARVAVHRLRRRFREIYREEIARTVGKDTDVDAELRHLAAALCNVLPETGKYPA